MQHNDSEVDQPSRADDRAWSNLDQRTLETIVANSANALLVLDQNGYVLFANRAAQRLFGRRPDQLEGSPFGFPLQPGLTVDAEIIRPDQSVVIVDLRVEPIEWQGSSALLAVLHDITERKQTEQFLIETQQLLHSALDALPSAIAILNRYGQVLAANIVWLQLGPLLGVESADCAVGASFLAACHLGQPPAGLLADTIERLLQGADERFEGEFAAVGDGHRWLAVRAVRFGNDERVRVVITLEDVSTRHQAEQIAVARRRVLEMIARQYNLKTIMRELLVLIGQQIVDLIYSAFTLHSHGLFVSCSAVLETADLQQFDAWAHEVLSLAPCRYQRITELASDTPYWWSSVEPLVRKYTIKRGWIIGIRTNRDAADGCLLLCRRDDTPLSGDERNLLEQIEQLTTITIEQQTTLEKLAYQAHHDTLTGLPNRLLFEDRLQQAIEHARRTDTLVAVLFIDLDRFKQINDTLGHTIGDLLLIQVARRFELCIRATDTLARHGGDEFLLVLPDITAPQQVAVVAQRLHESLMHPFFVNGHEIFVNASIGASLYPIDGKDVVALQRAADIAMYRAKQTHSSFQFFDATIAAISSERLRIETLLRRAIERNELLLFYQPLVDRTGTLVGLEALLRWQSAELGMVSPAKFISVAEETGLIVLIGQWVLHEIARQIKYWLEAGLPVVPVAANISAIQFAQTDFVEQVENILNRVNLPLSWLELELTESMLMGHIENLRQQLNRLRQLGVTLAVDDFGTGYSSLAYLHRLPINILKIDRSFVACLDQADSEVERSLVETIITLGHRLGMQVVAEGVETAEQYRILEAAGCDTFQGYYIARPLSVADVVDWLKKGRSGAAPCQ